jgi:hypothetical protein
LKRGKSGFAEAVAFACATLAYIWMLRPNRWFLLLLVGWAVLSIARRSTSPAEMGWSPRRFAEAMYAWRYGWLAGAVCLILILAGRIADSEILFRGGAYFVWCCIQQTVYQNLVYRPLRHSFDAGLLSWSVSGLIFGAVHLPNPVLAPATLLWGAGSSRLFEAKPSIPALALAQVLLSSLLYELTPWDWHHGFRVGPGYFGR